MATIRVQDLKVGDFSVSDLGAFLREQRQASQLSLRQLAEQAGVSNPYLSQVERGLRRPSAEVLQQIARALHISAEVLFVRAGILEDRAERPEVTAAVMADPLLTGRQRRVMLELYRTFLADNSSGDEEPPEEAMPEEAPAKPRKKSARPAKSRRRAQPDHTAHDSHEERS